jgi:hypothetical protein
MSGSEGVAPTVVVRTGGLNGRERLLIVGLGVGGLIGYGLVSFAVIDPGLVPLWIRLLLLTVVYLIVFLWIEDLWGTRKVTIDGTGVTFAYVIHRRFGLWQDLSIPNEPQPYAPRLRGIYIRRAILDKGLPSFWLHFVTKDQARAILQHPSCPIKDLEPGVRAYLGL